MTIELSPYWQQVMIEQIELGMFCGICFQAVDLVVFISWKSKPTFDLRTRFSGLRMQAQQRPAGCRWTSSSQSGAGVRQSKVFLKPVSALELMQLFCFMRSQRYLLISLNSASAALLLAASPPVCASRQ